MGDLFCGVNPVETCTMSLYLLYTCSLALCYVKKFLNVTSITRSIILKHLSDNFIMDGFYNRLRRRIERNSLKGYFGQDCWAWNKLKKVVQTTEL